MLDNVYLEFAIIRVQERIFSGDDYMETIVMNGIDIAKEIENEIKQETKGCIIRPSVAVIEIGDNPDSEKYMKLREDACNRVGIYFRYYKFEDNTPELTIINKIKELNNDDYVNGVTIQLPLPEKYNEKRLLNTIMNSKDIDGLTDINIGRLISGRKTIIPCGVLGIMELFKRHEIDVYSKHVVIIGNSKLITRPLINMMINEGATVTVCNSNTKNLKKHTKEADIIISAMGSENLITSDMVKDEVIIIDCGCISESGEMVGDVDYKSLSKKASFIAPPVGGVGPLVTAMFLKNTLLCYNNKK